jgi:hypothetical protein
VSAREDDSTWNRIGSRRREVGVSNSEEEEEEGMHPPGGADAI